MFVLLFALAISSSSGVPDVSILERHHGDGFDAYPSPSFVVKGARVTLICNRTGEPSFNPLWLYRDANATLASEKIVSASRGFPDVNVTGQLLIFPEFTEKHVGSYGCAFQSSGDIKESGFALLQLAVRPELTIFDVPAVNLSSSVTMRCATPGARPKPNHMSIWHKNVEVSSSYNKSGLNEIQYTISRVRKNESGYYTCETANMAGRQNRTEFLAVQYVPELQESSQSGTVLVNQGQTAMFWCRFDGFPSPIVDWYFRETKFASNSSTLSVEDANRQNDGVYKCKAWNVIGMAPEEVTFSLVVRVPPEPPTIDFSKTKKTEFSVTLHWSSGHSGFSPVIGYSVRYRAMADANWQVALNFSSDSVAMSFTVTGLEPFVSYEFQVAAGNAIGHGAFSLTLQEKTHPNAPHVGPTGLEYSNLTQSSVDLTWTPVETADLAASEGTLSYYEAGIQIKDEPEFYQKGSSAGHMTVTITEAGKYVIRVFARNSGPLRSPPSNSVEFSFGETAGEDKQSGLSLGIIVGIAVGGAVLIAIVLLTVCLCVRKRQGRSDFV